jgi:phosphohistidine phosphatase
MVMNLDLVQHGEAEPKDVDPSRPLTASGRETAERVAVFARRLGVEVAQIRHSGRTRAEQTSAILGEALEPAEGLRITSTPGPTCAGSRSTSFVPASPSRTPTSNPSMAGFETNA